MAGAIGPLGVPIEPLGPISFAQARDIFREQAEALVAAGMDLLVLETFYDLNELREAIFAVSEAAGPDIVLVAQVTVDDDGHLRGRNGSRKFYAQRLAEWPVDVIGLNCSAGPKAMLDTIEQMTQLTTQAAERDAERGTSGGAWKAATCTSARRNTWRKYARRFLWAGVTHRGRVLRDNARLHQADSGRGTRLCSRYPRSSSAAVAEPRKARTVQTLSRNCPSQEKIAVWRETCGG